MGGVPKTVWSWPFEIPANGGESPGLDVACSLVRAAMRGFPTGKRDPDALALAEEIAAERVPHAPLALPGSPAPSGQDVARSPLHRRQRVSPRLDFVRFDATFAL